MDFIETMRALWESTGIAHSIAHGEWQNYVMIVISFVLFYLAVVKQFEPLLLLPIAFGMFIVTTDFPIRKCGLSTRRRQMPVRLIPLTTDYFIILR